MSRLGPIFKGRDNYCIIPDTHFPYEHKDALEHVKRVCKVFHVPLDEPGRIFHVGDIVDSFHGSRWPKGGDYLHTPNQELELARESVQRWSSVIKYMSIATGNHCDRWIRKSFECEIPSQVMRQQYEVLRAPSTWVFKKQFIVKGSRVRFLVYHGDMTGLTGKTAITKHLDHYKNISSCFGHMHSRPGVIYQKTNFHDRIFSMNCGALVDNKAFVFKYGDKYTSKPVGGCGVVVDGGKAALWLPL